MRIIAQETLAKFWRKHPDSAVPLGSWLKLAKESKWKNSNDVKENYPYVSVLSNNRVVFNIKGNDYRLVVAFAFNAGIGYICFVGTHQEYDKIDANTIWDY